MVPKIIWQTYRSRTLPPKAEHARSSWLRLNPDWEYHFCDDEAITSFMDSEFPGDLNRAFREMPVGVMKADIWRYAVLHKHGGVYTDIDTTCLVPLSQWIESEAKLVLALENNTNFCQWTIASEPKHPVFEFVMRLIVERARSGIDLNYEHFVHEHTGPAVWTNATLALLEMQHLSPGEVYFEHRRALASRGIRIFPRGAFGGVLVAHAFGSQAFRGDGYVSWIDERDHLKAEYPLKF